MAFGQTFDVATVKPSPPLTGGGIRIGMNGGPGTRDPGRASYTGVTLKMLMQNAYGVKPYQISGPGWLDTERYDIVASVPEGATKEQFNVMLQNLLKERFGLEFHRETKEFPLYELTVLKNGPKMKHSAEVPAGAPEPPPPSGPAPVGKDGLPQLQPGRAGAMMMMRPGGIHMAVTMQPMERLTDMLGNQLGVPVVDKTGLTGNYDFTLDFAPEQGQGLMPGLPPPPPPPPGGDAGPGKIAVRGDPSDAPNIFTAVQEQLGLKLDKKKGPLDLLIVDHAGKTPTEN
jgi:uncharacterized protein (TIGR03435 family)